MTEWEILLYAGGYSIGLALLVYVVMPTRLKNWLLEEDNAN
jgi:hypothetical protein